jgi:hypothetical protein
MQMNVGFRKLNLRPEIQFSLEDFEEFSQNGYIYIYIYIYTHTHTHTHT